MDERRRLCSACGHDLQDVENSLCVIDAFGSAVIPETKLQK